MDSEVLRDKLVFVHCRRSLEYKNFKKIQDFIET